MRQSPSFNRGAVPGHARTANLTDEERADYDFVLLRTFASQQRISALAIQIWNDVLVELGRRGLVEAMEGSLEDVTTAKSRRSYPLPKLQ